MVKEFKVLDAALMRPSLRLWDPSMIMPTIAPRIWPTQNSPIASTSTIQATYKRLILDSLPERSLHRLVNVLSTKSRTLLMHPKMWMGGALVRLSSTATTPAQTKFKSQHQVLAEVILHTCTGASMLHRMLPYKHVAIHDACGCGLLRIQTQTRPTTIGTHPSSTNVLSPSAM